MVGAGLESGCWMVWEMVEWRLVASVSELESGCIVAELALRVPKGGRMSVVGARARSPAPLLYQKPAPPVKLPLGDVRVRRAWAAPHPDITLSVDGQTAHNVVAYCPKGVNR